MLVLLLIGLAAGDPVRFFEEDFLHPKQRAMMARMPVKIFIQLLYSGIKGSRKKEEGEE